MSKIQLKPASILKVPIQIYDKDFKFLVNGEEFKTSRLLSDLLSPNICNIHLTDPSFDEIIINTHNSGNFSHFINLQAFNVENISANELPFISEVLEILGNDSINFIEEEKTEITIDNVFSLIKKHQKNDKFYNDEIEFISSHFYLLYETQAEELESLSIDALTDIIGSKKIQLKDEDQLLHFINKMYLKSSTFSVLYEKVVYSNLSNKAMSDFIDVYDVNEMTTEMWRALSERLKQGEKLNANKGRYKKQEINVPFSEKSEFSGIISYLRNESSSKLENKVVITSSSIYHNEAKFNPKNVTFYDDKEKWFCSQDDKNSWICFDFKEHRVCPSYYTLKSANWGPNNGHPKNWVIEGSADNSSWRLLDEQSNCCILNGREIVHSFKIKNFDSNSEFNYIRMRQTGPNWCGDDYLGFKSFEIYGVLK
ncbi:hypothetical protein M9Y10_018961 [Tritrichomonas musculus]|uniref:F5/8 type C domain-containing protein n=1 Tax=Tritrichomonas musculus TaxID=1915356 RepID=A0ABR2HI93_9EUKA